MAFSRVRIPAGAQKLSLASADGDVSVFGVSLENGAPGVVYDTVGLPGAQFEVYLRAPESSFSAQLARRDPSLVVLMLGGNEAYELGRGWITLDDVRANATKLIDRVRAATPEADCLLFSPMDAGSGPWAADRTAPPHEGGQRRSPAKSPCPRLRVLGRARRDGRTGLGVEVVDAGLFHTDLVHPRATGADLLGHLFDFALERARSTRPSAGSRPGTEEMGLLSPSGSRWRRRCDKLAALEGRRRRPSRSGWSNWGRPTPPVHMFTECSRTSSPGSSAAPRGAGSSPPGALPAPRGRAASAGRSRASGRFAMPVRAARTSSGASPASGAEGEPGAKLKIAFGVDGEPGENRRACRCTRSETPRLGPLEVRDRRRAPVGGSEAAAPSRAGRRRGHGSRPRDPHLRCEGPLPLGRGHPCRRRSHRVCSARRWTSTGAGCVRRARAAGLHGRDHGRVRQEPPSGTSSRVGARTLRALLRHQRERPARPRRRSLPAHYSSLLTTLREASPSGGVPDHRPHRWLETTEEGRWPTARRSRCPPDRA